MTNTKIYWGITGIVSLVIFLFIKDIDRYEHQMVFIFALLCLLISVCSLIVFIFWPNYTTEQVNELKIKYDQCLSSNDKSGAAYWGERYYYSLYEPYTIHQQNQIQLKIQNDILSYSK
jgi:hypothetical protein